MNKKIGIIVLVAALAVCVCVAAVVIGCSSDKASDTSDSTSVTNAQQTTQTTAKPTTAPQTTTQVPTTVQPTTVKEETKPEQINNDNEGNNNSVNNNQSNNNSSNTSSNNSGNGFTYNTGYDGYSTAILANQDILARNLANNGYDINPYYIKVNKTQNCVTVYTYDSNGDYTVPVRAMVCSCGLDGSTVTGDFEIYYNQEWNGLFGDVYGYYTVGFYGNYLFHSVPYYDASPDTLKTSEYNKLGQDASLGCVRLAVADEKWIFDNCYVGTPVTVYEDSNPGPLGRPEPMRITDLDCGWDPTDPDSDNPYANRSPQIVGAKNVIIDKGTDFDMFKGITALDTCSNDITGKMVVSGNVSTDKEGSYEVTYSVEDAMHRTATKTIVVTVV